MGESTYQIAEKISKLYQEAYREMWEDERKK